MANSRRQSRVFTISFPEDLAQQVDKVAKEESRNISELFREAFRSYRMARVRQRLNDDLEYSRQHNSESYTPADVEQFVDEIRARRHRKTKNSA